MTQYHFQIRCADLVNVAILHEQATVDALVVQPGQTFWLPLAAAEYAHVLLGSQNFQCLFRHGWSDDHLGKLTVDDLSQIEESNEANNIRSEYMGVQ